MVSVEACGQAGGVPIKDVDDCDQAGCEAPPRDPPPAPDPPPRRGSAGIKGSVLILPAYEVRWDRHGHVVRDTFISITNDHPESVSVLLYFVNGDEPIFNDDGSLRHPGWNFADNLIQLTGNEPAWWAVSSGLPKGTSPISVLDPGAPRKLGPGRPVPDVPGETLLRGFVVAIAVHPLGDVIRWNHLSATVTQVDYVSQSAMEYAAHAFPVVDPAIPHGGSVGTPGEILLDGTHFAYGYELLLMNFHAVGSVAFTGTRFVSASGALIVLPIDLDLRFGFGAPTSTWLRLDIWNENEVKFSGLGRCITCWDATLLSQYGSPNHFLIPNLQTDGGKARMAGIASPGCPGSVATSITGVAVRDLSVEGYGRDRTASLLTGMGLQAARLRFDPLLPPPEAPSKPGQ